VIKGFAGLSLEQSPPFALASRFFITAALFGVAGGILLLVLGPAALESRWNPAAMALTHVFTLGYLTMVMCGAILQMLPVLGGVPVPGIMPVGSVVHGLLVIGTVSLVGGFFSGNALGFDVAVIALGGAILLFLGAVALGIWRVGASNPTVRAIRSAAVGLFVTLLFGAYLVSLLAGYGNSPHMPQFIDLHLGWGLAGWLGMLLMGVALRMVPMFQMTPEYPAPVVRWGLSLTLLLLLIWSLAVLQGQEALRLIAEGGVVGVYAVFALLTLCLQRSRRRRTDSVHTAYWWASAAAILVAAGLWVAARSGSGQDPAWLPVLWGMTVLGGVAVSVINGMLYKIVPFLAWYHLQQRQMAMGGVPGLQIPHMLQLLPSLPVRRQFQLHLAMLAVGAGAAVFPQSLARPLGLLVLLSFALLTYNLLFTVRLYRRTRRRMAVAAAGVCT
jgi:hypothetical protein